MRDYLIKKLVGWLEALEVTKLPLLERDFEYAYTNTEEGFDNAPWANLWMDTRKSNFYQNPLRDERKLEGWSVCYYHHKVKEGVFHTYWILKRKLDTPYLEKNKSNE